MSAGDGAAPAIAALPASALVTRCDAQALAAELAASTSVGDGTDAAGAARAAAAAARISSRSSTKT